LTNANILKDPIKLIDPLGDDTWVYGSNGNLLVQVKDKLPPKVIMTSMANHLEILAKKITKWEELERICRYLF